MDKQNSTFNLATLNYRNVFSIRKSPTPPLTCFVILLPSLVFLVLPRLSPFTTRNSSLLLAKSSLAKLFQPSVALTTQPLL